MSDNNNEQADWQKNSGRPSNFHEKDDKLKKDGDGNLKIKKEKNKVLQEKEQKETIQNTLDSINDDEE